MAGLHPFDKPYEFAILLFVSNSIQLLTPIFILVSQNIQDRRTKALAEQQYQIARKDATEFKQMMGQIQEISMQIKNLFKKIEKNQYEIIDHEDEQNIYHGVVSDSLVKMLTSMSGNMDTRPCLLQEAAADPDIANLIITALKAHKLKKELEEDPE